jgi:vitamin B12 transporter
MSRCIRRWFDPMSPETGLGKKSNSNHVVRGRTMEIFMHKSVRGLAGLSVLFGSFPAMAADDLHETIITANRTATSLDTTVAATTVITRAQIEAMQARSLEDLLRGVDGLNIGNSGGPGKLTSFFVRGTEPEHLLVLIDGVRIGSATAGTAALQNIPVESIDRIEFVRGPRSSLYGSEAVGGVLQIFTRRGGGGLQAEASLSGGSYDTRQASASLSGGDEQAWFSVQGAAQSTDGFDSCYGSSTLFAGCFTEEPDSDGYRYRSLSARAGMKFGDGTLLEANLLRAPSRVEYDGSFTNRSRLLQQVAGLGLTQTFSEGNQLALRLGSSWDRSDDFLDDDFMGDFNTRRDSIGAQWDWQFAMGQILTVGAEYVNDKVSGSTDFDEKQRDNKALFLQYVGDHGPWRTELSWRGDDNQQFGKHDTLSAALGYVMSDALQFVAQYGTAFRAPSFNELYYPDFSNPLLDPERSRSFELAAKGRVDGTRWRVSLFNTKIRDLVGFDDFFLPANVDAARIRGVEASALIPWHEWTLELGTTLLDTENRSDDANQGNRLMRRPKFSGHLDLARRFGELEVGARLVAEGARYDNASNTRRVGGFTTLDLRAEYAVTPAWRVQARAANVLDEDYETVAFYNQPGRAIYVTLRYNHGAQ